MNGHAETSGVHPLAPELPEPAPTGAPAAVAPKPEVSATEEPEEPTSQELGPSPEELPPHRPRTSEPRLTHDYLRTNVRAERLVALVAEVGSPGVPVTVEHLVVRSPAPTASFRT